LSKLRLEIPLSTGRIRKLSLTTDRNSGYCSIFSIHYENSRLALFGCDALAPQIQNLYAALYDYIRNPPTIGGSLKDFEYELTVVNYRFLKPVSRKPKKKKEPQKILFFSGVKMADAIYLKVQLEHFILFMTGWPPS